ncbi:MAG: hypothetical protein QFC55_03295 [Chloroflexota bacterium]|nr:hypothetical protein [Chloroflexota bacterium]
MKWLARVLIVIGFLAALAAAPWFVLDRPWTIERYRVVDDRTLLVTVASGPLDWTRVTSVVETPSSVEITVTSFRPPAPGTGGPAIELAVQLAVPLADRTVIDASSGQPVLEWTSP